MINSILKTLLLGMTMAGFSLIGMPVLAEEDAEAPAPATEHQSETLKKDVEDAAGDTKKETTGDKEKTKSDIPATEHQEESLKGGEDSGDSSLETGDEPAR